MELEIQSIHSCSLSKEGSYIGRSSGGPFKLTGGGTFNNPSRHSPEHRRVLHIAPVLNIAGEGFIALSRPFQSTAIFSLTVI
jgi:hypothetical protein